MKGNYAIFIELQDYKNKENLIYYGLSKENSFFLADFKNLDYNFVELLWSSVIKMLNLKEISFIYGVGVADSFYQNYLIAEELIEDFLSVHKGTKSKQFNADIDAFKAKWNLSTYFYLRNNVFIYIFFYFFINFLHFFLSIFD